MIYVASSFRNPYYEGVLDCLEQWNIAYYNWKDSEGFHWSEADPRYKEYLDTMTVQQYKSLLHTDRASRGFARDMKHLREAEAVILLLPCGRSAHLEAGWAVGGGLPVAIYMKEHPVVPELMYAMTDLLTNDIDELMQWSNRNTRERIIR